MNIKDTRADTIMEYMCRIMLAGTLIYLIVCWNRIPGQIPTHYNAAGEIDGWGGKSMIWFTVIIVWVLYLGISFVERYPDLWNQNIKTYYDGGVYGSGHISCNGKAAAALVHAGLSHIADRKYGILADPHIPCTKMRAVGGSEKKRYL